ncbi:MAG: hypothetical protein AAFZ07_22445 [Actinomycetota bacterium]
MATDPPPGRPEPRARTNVRTRLLLGTLAFVAATVLLVLVTFGPARDREVSNLGDDVFDLGNTTRIAAEIADRGPILFPDVGEGNRPIYVNHLSSSVDTGWVAFSALAPAPPADCVIEWDEDAELFVACDGRTFPPDGAGLDPFVIAVDGSIVSIDLNFAERDEPILGVDDEEDE